MSPKELKWMHDNARPRTSAETLGFLERQHIERIFQAPYSPNLKLCDRWLFPQMKMMLLIECLNRVMKLRMLIENFKTLFPVKF